MSSARSRSGPLAEPAFDLDYSLEDSLPPGRLDSEFFFQRVKDAVIAEGAASGRRVLDVACGLGEIVQGLGERGAESWGIDSSDEMLRLSRRAFPEVRLPLVRGIAEAMPFRDGAFDGVVCQGSLDHFVDPSAFMREASRILRGDGRLVIALANFESMSCVVGRSRHRLVRFIRRLPRGDARHYWHIPPDHYHTGNLAFVRRLGGSSFKLERCYGISLFWLTSGWAGLLQRLPRKMANRLLTGADRVARRTPRFADMIVSIWRPLR